MKRNIKIVRPGKLVEALDDIDRIKLDIVETHVGAMIDNDCSLAQILTYLNNRDDLTDAEWTAAIYALGHYCGRTGL